MTGSIPITKQGFEDLKAELKTLLTVERPNIQKAIAEARAHGDLRENAEYHAAKDKQSFIEGRIQEINAKMGEVRVVDVSKVNADTIAFGARVTMENVDTGEQVTYQIVGPDEADLKTNRISFQTPIAKALIGKSIGDSVTIQIPKGNMTVEIISVSYH